MTARLIGASTREDEFYEYLAAHDATGRHHLLARSTRPTLGPVAEAAGAELVELECVAPPSVASLRLARRAKQGGDPSDATAPVAVAMAAAWQRWAGAHAIDTDRPGEVVLAEALSAISAP